MMLTIGDFSRLGRAVARYDHAAGLLVPMRAALLLTYLAVRPRRSEKDGSRPHSGVGARGGVAAPAQRRRRPRGSCGACSTRQRRHRRASPACCCASRPRALASPGAAPPASPTAPTAPRVAGSLPEPPCASPASPRRSPPLSCCAWSSGVGSPSTRPSRVTSPPRTRCCSRTAATDPTASRRASCCNKHPASSTTPRRTPTTPQCGPGPRTVGRVWSRCASP